MTTITDTNYTNHTSDEAIVRRVWEGDREAFALLVGRYQTSVYRMAHHYLGNAVTEDAQDATQEAFVRAFQRLGQLSDPGRFAPWLRQLAANICRLRLRERRRMTGEALPETLPAPDNMTNLTTRLYVRQALAVLSPEVRETVLLYYGQEQSLAEIATFLDVPVTTVKSRLRDARARLRKELQTTMAEEIGLSKALPADFTAKVMREIAAAETIRTLVFSPDGKLLAAEATQPNANEERRSEIQIWEVTTGELRAVTRINSWASGLNWSSDSQRITFGCGTVASSTNNGHPSEVNFWDWEQGSTGLHTFAPIDEGPVFATAYSPDGALLAVCSSTWRESAQSEQPTRGEVYLYDVATGERRLTVEHLSQTWAVVFSPEGKTFATGAGQVNADKSEGVWSGGSVCLWDTATGALQQTFARPHARAQSRIAFSPDGRLLATGDGPEGDVLLYDIAKGTLRYNLRGHNGPVYAVAFSPSGNLLATGSKDGTVRLWDTVTGALRKTLNGHETAVHSVAFSPDGRTLVSADTQRGVIKVWNIG